LFSQHDGFSLVLFTPLTKRLRNQTEDVSKRSKLKLENGSDCDVKNCIRVHCVAKFVLKKPNSTDAWNSTDFKSLNLLNSTNLCSERTKQANLSIKKFHFLYLNKHLGFSCATVRLAWRG